MNEEIFSSPYPTLRTCLLTLSHPLKTYVTARGDLANALSPMHVLTQMESEEEGRKMLDEKAVICTYQSDAEALDDEPIAGIYLVSDQGDIDLNEEAVYEAHHLFNLKQFRLFLYGYGKNAEYPLEHPLITYGKHLCSVNLAFEGYRVYRTEDDTETILLPRWAIILNSLIASVKTDPDLGWAGLKWNETLRAFVVHVNRLIQHVDELEGFPY